MKNLIWILCFVLLFFGCTNINVNVPKDFRGKFTISEVEPVVPIPKDEPKDLKFYRKFISETGATVFHIVGFTSLIGGGSGALDAIECEDVRGNGTDEKILDGSLAFGWVNGTLYAYTWDIDSTETEDATLYEYIEPDDQSECPAPNANKGAWLLIDSYASARSATPSIILRDSGATDRDDNAKIYANCDDGSCASTSEDVDVYFQAQIGGSMTTFIHFDCDASGNCDVDLTPSGTGKIQVSGGQIDIADLAATGNWTPNGTIDFGSTTDTSFKANTIDSDDINTIVDSVVWNAAGITPDGSQCNAPAKNTINSGPTLYTIICADSDTSIMYGHVTMPDSWNAGTVLFSLSYIQTAADTSALYSDVDCQCRGAGETPSSTWGTSSNIDDTNVTGSNANDQTDAAASVTCAGTCVAGDELYWRLVLDDATTTAVATLHFTGMKMEYTSNVGD